MKTRVYAVGGVIDFNNSTWQWMGDSVTISDSENQNRIIAMFNKQNICGVSTIRNEEHKKDNDTTRAAP